MKKEVKRLEEKYNIEITLQMEKSDPLDNRSPRCYRVDTSFGWSDEIGGVDFICEYGFCKNWQDIIKRFEEKLIERFGY